MSSNTGQAPKTGAQAGAKEAEIDFLLEEIGKRSSSPTQAVKVCQILNLASGENIRRVREIAKNKNASDLVGQSRISLAKAEAKNKNQEEKMKVVKGRGFYKAEALKLARKYFSEDQIKDMQLPYSKVSGSYGFYISDCGEFNVARDHGFNSIEIRVTKKEVMPAVKKFAKAYERKSRQFKKDRDVTVIIYQDF